MKKNFQFIVVIFFVTLAFLIMLNDVRKHTSHEYQKSVELYQVNDKVDVAATDLNDLE